MSDITLSASVRQNLLSLQSTSQLLATTQERLATGNKVNSALDNPTNFFTAQSLNNRASDISNLLDSVGNGVQVLQAANTGITSLQKLIDSAKSVANQALQATSGYTTKSQIVSTTITGATAGNLLGTASYSDVVAQTGTAVNNNATGAPVNTVFSGSVVDDDSIPGTFDGAAIGATQTAAATVAGSTDLSDALANHFASGDSFTLTVGGTTKTFQFYDSAASGTDPTAGDTIGVDLNGTTSNGSVLTGAINTAFGAGTAALDGTTGDLTITAQNLTDSVAISANSALGFATTVNVAPTPATVTATTATKLSGLDSTATGSLSGSIADGNSFTVNGKTVTLATSGTTSVNAITGGLINISTGTVNDVVDAINTIAGGSVASIVDGKLHIDANQAPAGINVDLANSSGSPLAALGLTGPVSVTNTDGASSSTGITASSALAGTPGSTSTDLATAITTTDSFKVNGVAISFDGTQGGTTSDATGYHLDLTTATVGDVLNVIDKITGTFGTASASTVSGGKLNLSSGTGNAGVLDIADGTGAAAGTLAKLGLDGLAGANNADRPATATITGSTALTSLATSFTTSDTIGVDGKTIAFYDSGAGGSAGTDANTTYLDLHTATVQDVLSSIDQITGASGSSASTISGGQITVHTGTAQDLSLSGTGLAKLGLTATTTPVARQANSTLDGLTLNIGATDGGSAVSITFGTADGQVDTLDELNAALKSNNLEASLDTTGKLTISTTNDHSAATIGAISGTAVSYAGSPFSGATVAGPVANTDSQNSRASLVAQYNNIIDQIRTTAQDASFNGVNLLNGDKLSLVFNETGTSKLDIQGVTDDPSGLGLSALTAGTDFLDNSSANKILASLNSASSILRSQGSTLGSNLSVVQIRQDFSNNLINVLQTGASNLTLADTNEEAANSQALSTRQSIAVSALALANTSQQSVLRLLQ